MPYIPDVKRQNYSTKIFVASLPLDIQEMLNASLYKIFRRDDFTHSLVIECPTPEIAIALSRHKQKIYSTLSKILKTPVEGAIVYCANRTRGINNCDECLGCVFSAAKAY